MSTDISKLRCCARCFLLLILSRDQNIGQLDQKRRQEEENRHLNHLKHGVGIGNLSLKEHIDTIHHLIRLCTCMLCHNMKQMLHTITAQHKYDKHQNRSQHIEG